MSGGSGDEEHEQQLKRLKLDTSEVETEGRKVDEKQSSLSSMNNTESSDIVPLPCSASRENIEVDPNIIGGVSNLEVDSGESRNVSNPAVDPEKGRNESNLAVDEGRKGSNAAADLDGSGDESNPAVESDKDENESNAEVDSDEGENESNAEVDSDEGENESNTEVDSDEGENESNAEVDSDEGENGPAEAGEEGIQVPPMYEDLMTRRQVINNLRVEIEPLQKLASEIVAKIVRNCAKNEDSTINPLEGLSGPILTLLYKVLYGEDRLYFNRLYREERLDFNIAKYLITEASQVVKLTFAKPHDYNYRAWTREKVTSIIKLLDMCKNHLLELKLSIDSSVQQIAGPSLYQVNYILTQQSNLNELSLPDCNINDQTLAVIGSTCLKLRILDISNNNEVSDEGLAYLCASESPHGKCTKLASLNVDKTKVTSSGVAKLMAKIPKQIEEVKVDEYKYKNELFHIFLELYKLDPSLCLLKWKNLTIDLSILKKYPNILEIVPNITEVELNINCYSDNITPLIKFDKITTLIFKIKCRIDLKQIYNLILKHKETLTELKIQSNIVQRPTIHVDFSITTQIPNLKKLQLKCVELIPAAYLKYNLLPSSFRQLRSFSLKLLDIICHIPNAMLIRMLSSKYLDGLTVNFKIPPYIMEVVIIEANENIDIFSKLRIINFLGGTDISIDTLCQLVCILPKYSVIDFRADDNFQFPEILMDLAVRNMVQLIMFQL